MTDLISEDVSILFDFDALYTQDDIRELGANWLDLKFPNNVHNNCIFDGLTYRVILNSLFDKNKSIYRIIEYNKIDYTKHKSVCSLTSRSRTTLLREIIKNINNVQIKVIFKCFLRHASNINFIHPAEYTNALSIMFDVLVDNKYPDVVMLLLQRKETQSPIFLLYLQHWICESQHIKYIMDNFKYNNANEDKLKIYFSNILYNYIKWNTVYSRDIVEYLFENANVDFDDIYDIIFKDLDRKLTLVKWIQWDRVSNYNKKKFSFAISCLFEKMTLLLTHAHELISIYYTIARQYAIYVKIPESHIERLLAPQMSRPEHIILFDCVNGLDTFRPMLSDTCKSARYIRHRYNLRYRKYILYWRHKTYRPGSKVYINLFNKHLNTWNKNDVIIYCEDPLLFPDIKQLEIIIYR